MSTPSLRAVDFRVRDGATIHAVVQDAKADAPRIALVHSLAMDHGFWQAVIERLGPDYAVLAIDARQHGASTKSPGPVQVSQLSDDLHDALEQLGWASAVVAGASMGGCVALQHAIDYPQHTAGLGLFGTTSWYGPEAPAEWKARGDKARREGLASLVEFQKTRWLGAAFRAAHPEIVQQALDVFLRNDIDAYAATCDMLGAFNASDKLSSVKTPTTILVGEEDMAAPPAMARTLHDGIAGSTLRVLPGARHLLPLETPDIVADAIIALARGRD